MEEGYLEVAAIGGEDRVGQVVACAYRSLGSCQLRRAQRQRRRRRTMVAGGCAGEGYGEVVWTGGGRWIEI